MAHFTAHGPGRTVRLPEGEFLYFCGTSYLGMPANEDFAGLIGEGFRKYGNNFGTSRTSNLRLDIFDQTENFLAQKTGTEAVLLYSSGYLAGQAAASYLKAEFPDAEFSCGPGTHPAVLPENAVNETGNWQDWLRKMIDKINSDNSGKKFVLICDAANTTQAKVHDFSCIAEIKQADKVLIFIDDSHTFGILSEGAGVGPTLPESRAEILLMASTGKACGVPAGFVAGRQIRKDGLRESPFFRGSSPPLPGFLHAFLQAEPIYRENLRKLQQNCALFTEKTKDSGLFISSENYPVFYTTSDELFSFLLKKEILIASFAYPKKGGPMLTRIIISALHEREDILRLADACLEFSISAKKQVCA